jgi:two-component system, cell cycle sensor histidine kinase and response regulator CckA
MTRILIVDDNKENRYFLETLFTGLDFDVMSTKDGAEALERAHQTPPDIIVTDILMPVMDGYALCREWKGDPVLKHIPFIFYTATYTDPKDEAFALSLGAERFIIKPADPEVLEQAVREVLAQGIVSNAEETPSECQQEARYLKDYNEVLFRKLEKKMIALEKLNQSMTLEIAERKQAAAALKQSEAEFRAIFELASIGIAQADTHTGKFLRVNQKMSAITGYSSGELLQMRVPDVIHPDDRQRDLEAFRNFVNGASPYYQVEKRYVRKDGALVWVNVNMTIIRDAAGKPERTIATVEDISVRRKLEEQLRHAQKMEAIGTLAGGVAHDFNNILNVIMGYGSMVLNRQEPGSLSREQIQEMLAAGERAAALTKQLLVFSRKEVVEVRAVNINEIITGVQKLLGRVIGEDIELQVNLADGRLTVLADAGQLEQVLMNLATNARDAMPKGGHLAILTETVCIEEEYPAAYRYGKPGMYAVITVADTGLGMDEETRQKIFEPFFTTKEVGEGTGLGLAISYGIVKQHGGFINCYSEPGKGTVLKIYLPVMENAAVSGLNAKAFGAVKGGTETILVAEDDPSLRKLTGIILESFGYSVVTAENGEDAVVKFMEQRGKIKLVILDLVMPKKNGKEANEEIQKLSPGIKTFFLSGYTMDMISRMEIEKGMEVLHKPIVPNDLLRKVREVLDR